MTTYFTIPTIAGQAAIEAAIQGTAPLAIASMAVGDGSGSPVTPIQSQTALVNQVALVAVQSLARDSINANLCRVSAILDETYGGFTIREMGLVDVSGNLLFVANVPDTAKVSTNQGVADVLTLEMDIAVSATASLTLTVSGAAWATQAYVAAQIETLKTNVVTPVRPYFIAVISASTATPPSSPATGDTYLVPHSGATGAWSSHADRVAQWIPIDPEGNPATWIYRDYPAASVVAIADTGDTWERIAGVAAGGSSAAWRSTFATTPEHLAGTSTILRANPAGVAAMIAASAAANPTGAYNIVFNSATAPILPTRGVIDFYNTASSGAISAVIDATGMTTGLTLMGVCNVQGATTNIIGSNGVFVNFPESANAAIAHGVLNSNAFPQGVWSGATYGQEIALPYSVGSLPIGGWLPISSTQVLLAWGSSSGLGLTLAVYNPTTRALGAAYNLPTASLWASTGQWPALKMFSTGSASAVLFIGVQTVALTLSGQTISAAVLAAVPIAAMLSGGASPAAGLGWSVAQLSTGNFVYAGVDNVTTGKLHVFAVTVSGTTVTWQATAAMSGTPAAWSNVSGSYNFIHTIGIAPLTATTALVGVSTDIPGSTTCLLDVATFSSGTVTLSGEVAPTRQINRLIPNGSGVVGLCRAAYSGDRSAVCGITVSGSTITVGTPVAIGAVAGTGISAYADLFQVPYGGGGPFTFAYGAGQFLWVDTTIWPFTVSGTTATVGTALNSAATETTVAVAADGTWAFAEQSSSPRTCLFSVVANAVIPSTTIAAAFLPNPGTSFGGTLMYGWRNVSGTWMAYPSWADGTTYSAVVTGPGYYQNPFLPIDAAGDALVIGTVNAVLANYF